MNEAEWLGGADPAPILGYLQAGARPSGRRLRLFACACCRQAWHLLTDGRSRRAVEVAERFADGLANDAEREKAAADAYDVMAPGALRAWACLSPEPARGVPMFVRAYQSDPPGTPAAWAGLLREVLGNPFRPPPSEPCTLCAGGVIPTDREDDTCPCCRGGGRRFPRRWLTPAARSVARRAYEGRAPDGTLDPATLAVLADALEEAGCEDGPLLWHLRGQDPCPCLGVPCCQLSEDPDPRRRKAHTCALCRGASRVPLPGPHVAGCWALDCVLGKG